MENPIAVRKTGREPFLGLGADEQLQGFLSWACSDLLGNAMRGLLAEYIVGLALGCVADGVRIEWDTADLITAGRTLVEVKSSAYLQSWAQRKPSTISFGIGPTRKYDYQTNTYAEKSRRQAHVYVFCVFAHTERATANPLNLAQWDFYVASTARLDEVAPGQKTIRLDPLLTRVRPRRARFADLDRVVAEVAASGGRG